MTEVVALFMETSDQTGASELVGIYSSLLAAETAADQSSYCRQRRTYTKRFIVDAPPPARLA